MNHVADSAQYHRLAITDLPVVPREGTQHATQCIDTHVSRLELKVRLLGKASLKVLFNVLNSW
jgi:hypothetical protein